MNTQELAKAFTDMCAKGELEAAGKKFWSDDIVSREPMTGDMAEAIRHAGNIPNENTALGQVAQVLAAQASGKPDEVAKSVDRLKAVGPRWLGNPQKELSRLVPDRAIVDRLTKGLAVAGIPGGS